MYYKMFLTTMVQSRHPTRCVLIIFPNLCVLIIFPVPAKGILLQIAELSLREGGLKCILCRRYKSAESIKIITFNLPYYMVIGWHRN